MTILKKQSKATVIISMLLIVLLLFCSCEKQEAIPVKTSDTINTNEYQKEVREKIRIANPTEEDWKDLEYTLLDFQNIIIENELYSSTIESDDDIYPLLKTPWGALNIPYKLHNGQLIEQYICSPLQKREYFNEDEELVEYSATWEELFYMEKDPLDLMDIQTDESDIISSGAKLSLTGENVAGYIRVPARFFEWLINGVFRGNTNRSVVKSYPNYGVLYYYEGYYYFPAINSGGESQKYNNVSYFTSPIDEELGIYNVYFYYYLEYDGITYGVEKTIFFATVGETIDKNGFKYWEIGNFGVNRRLNNNESEELETEISEEDISEMIE